MRVDFNCKATEAQTLRAVSKTVLSCAVTWSRKGRIMSPVGDDLDFSAEEYRNMSYRQRVCRLLTDRARGLAQLATPNHREAYLRIANERDQLAEEMERVG